MTPFWITDSAGKQFCVEASDKDAAIAISVENGRDVKSIDRIPYPATPRVGPESKCPPFCCRPKQCLGKSSCPHSYACSE